MTQKKTAIVLGSTGLVGKSLVELLIQDDLFSNIKLLLRRPSGIDHPKIDEHIVYFDDIDSFKDLIKGDVLFSCMGTTLKQAGSKEAQYKVDYTYQYDVAKAAADQGVSDFLLVSSANANAKSFIFYSRLKGELDEAVMKLPFDRVSIFRPSVLIGARSQKRKGEVIGGKLMNGLGRVFPPMKKYRGIKGTEVAQAMLAAYKNSSSEKAMIYTLEEVFDLLNSIDANT
ncbi:MAG: NAD(P)H-binding protein [Bacteroidales bacterium]|nr:NAD(P)H-binding protein [Bacteroidales bacterium]